MLLLRRWSITLASISDRKFLIGWLVVAECRATTFAIDRISLRRVVLLFSLPAYMVQVEVFDVALIEY